MTGAPAIRPFRTADRDALRDLACDTADSGGPVDPIFPDRRAVADLLTLYYVDFEPGSIWIAERGSTTVAGYLTGCLDTGRYRRIMLRRIVPGILLRAAGRGTPLRPAAWRLAACLLHRRSWAPASTRDLLRDYPAHLHVNLRPAARGQGIGRALVERFVAQARAARCPALHVSVRASNTASQAFFQRLGFTLPKGFPPAAAGHRVGLLDTVVLVRLLDT